MADKIYVINAREEDLNSVVELENKIWPEGTRATEDKFRKRFEIFHKGFFLAFRDEELIGVSTSEIIEYDPLNPPSSWEQITDNGYIEKTHNPRGNALYVVSIGAVSRRGGGSILVRAQQELAKRLDLRCLVLGARIPGYGVYYEENGGLDIEDYVRLNREDGELLDPELRFYTRNGLKLYKIMSNYMEDDQESRHYGAIMVWTPD